MSGDPYADYRDEGFSFTRLTDLADRRLGGGVVAANDEFFAERENLLSRSPAVFDVHHYGIKGKVMDGWETRCRRVKGNDWIVYRLAAQSEIRAVEVDTANLKGNAAGWVSLSVKDGASGTWTEALPRVPLQPDTLHRFPLDAPATATRARLDVYPDGGLARLRLHGAPTPAGMATLAARTTRAGAGSA